MRETRARLAAIATGALVLAAVVAFALAQQRREGLTATARPPAEAPAEDRVADRAPTEPAAPVDPADPVDPAHQAAPAGSVPAAPPEATAPDDRRQDLLALGARVYAAKRCARCHSIAGEGSPRSPLDGVGDRLGAEEVRLWIVAPRSMDPGVRKPAYDLPENELEALVAYMLSLSERTPRR